MVVHFWWEPNPYLALFFRDFSFLVTTCSGSKEGVVCGSLDMTSVPPGGEVCREC